MKPIFSLAEPLVVIVSSLIVIGGAIWALVSWMKRPRFIVGVPPNKTERDLKKIPSNKLARKSIARIVKHEPDCFAIPVRDRQELSKKDRERLFSNKVRYRLRCRQMNLAPDNSSSLSVVIENSGGRAARDYFLGIQILNPYVHMIDVKTESLDVYSFYTEQGHLIEDSDFKKKVSDKEIVEAYNNYTIELGEQVGDVLFLKGCLEGGVYELILIKIVTEPFINRFVTTFSIDCRDWCVSRQNFIQGFDVIPAFPKGSNSPISLLEPKNAGAITENILQALNSKDFAKYTQDFDENMNIKRMTTSEEAFNQLVSPIIEGREGGNGIIGYYIANSKQFSYAGIQDKYTIVVYRAKFTNESDDVKVTVSFKEINGKVHVAGLHFDSLKLRFPYSGS